MRVCIFHWYGMHVISTFSRSYWVLNSCALYCSPSGPSGLYKILLGVVSFSLSFAVTKQLLFHVRIPAHPPAAYLPFHFEYIHLFCASHIGRRNFGVNFDKCHKCNRFGHWARDCRASWPVFPGATYHGNYTNAGPSFYPGRNSGPSTSGHSTK